MGSCAAPSAKGDDKFITTDYLQQCPLLDDLKKRGITFIAIKDRIDTNAPVIGEIYTHLMAIFSSFERNRNIERTRSGLAAARARG
ncbi:recombinase family protein [Klebsiella pneumoniae]|nr:recombinase family protein [Klebsiella pneumoniae]